MLIEFHQLDENLDVVERDVLAAAPTKEDIYKRLLTVEPGKNTAIRCCGEWPTDVAVMFWLHPTSWRGLDIGRRSRHTGQRAHARCRCFLPVAEGITS